MLGVLGLLLVAVSLALDVLVELGCEGVVVVQGNADPGKLDPDPSLIVVQGRLDHAHPVILPDLVERELRPALDLLEVRLLVVVFHYEEALVVLGGIEVI